MLSGWIVEKTNIMGRLNYTEDMSDSEKDKMMMTSKSNFGKALVCFSPYRNMVKLFYSAPQKDGDLDVLNGIRVLSMCWVILGHAYFTSILSPVSNIKEIPDALTSWFYPIIPGGFFAVDSFFFLSSFLGTYLMIGPFYNRSFNLKKVFMIYLHRYLRLVPPMLALTLFLLTFLKYMGDGPLYDSSV